MSFLSALPAIAGTGLGALPGGPVGAAIGGSIGGSVSSAMGQGEANQANWDSARASEAFQERMSSTAHQRQTEDLKKAGLNPILSANSGSSTPTGAQSVSENTMEGFGTDAVALAQLGQEMKLKKKQANLLDAQIGKTNMETKVMSRGEPAAEIMTGLWDQIKSAAGYSARVPEGSTKVSIKPPKAPHIHQIDRDKATRQINKDDMMNDMRTVIQGLR